MAKKRFSELWVAQVGELTSGHVTLMKVERVDSQGAGLKRIKELCLERIEPDSTDNTIYQLVRLTTPPLQPRDDTVRKVALIPTEDWPLKGERVQEGPTDANG